MAQFGKKLLESRHEPWARYYLDYSGLKRCLTKKTKLLEQDVPPPPPSDWGSPIKAINSPSTSSPLMSHDTSEQTNCTQSSFQHHQSVSHFETFLEGEVEKIGLFFLQVQGEIAAAMNDARSRQAIFFMESEISGDPDSTGHSQVWHGAPEKDSERGDHATLQKFYSEFHSLAVTLLRLIHFVEANVTGIRKILKKHDKVTKKHLTFQYLSLHLGGKSHQLKHLWTNLLVHQYEGITALYVTMKVAVTELKNIEYQMKRKMDRHSFTPPASANASGKPPLANGHPPRPSKGRHRPARMSMPNIVLPPEGESSVMSQVLVPWRGGAKTSKSRTPDIISSRKPYGSTRQLLELHASAITSFEVDAVLLKVESARRRLNISSTSFQDVLAAQIVMLEPTGSDDIPDQNEDDEDAEVTAIAEKWLSHFLNLTSTFLYMTNYYVVAPTSGHYAQRLGGNEALAGIIIGMTPVAALVSTVLYSWWTSYSYKSALVCASTCSIVGNVFYALGLPCNSLSLVMIGRLLNGFGSARSINRRYIADTFPPRQRTAQSANFVTAGALGMAAGPALASLLHIGSSSTESLHSHTEETITDDNGNYEMTKITVNDDDFILHPNSNVWWTPENSPGWFMCVVWSIYLVLLCLHFEDPPKHTVAREKSISKGVEASGEKEALLGLKQKESGGDDSLFGSQSDETKEVPIWRNIPVMTTFVVYFVLKLVLECILSSTTTLTKFYFEWNSTVSGIYLAVLGLLMLPANLGISILARNYDDRELILGCEVFMLVGCVGIIQYTSQDSYSAIQYILFSVVIFLSTNGLEGPNMSLLSQTIPKSWSRGIFNVGLLATEAGTLGRAVGDLLLSVWGFNGLGTILNSAFRTMSILSALSLALTLFAFKHMEPIEQYD